MTKREIMTTAWTLAREGADKFGGKPAQYIAEALRIAWKESKTMNKPITERIDELTAMGFNRWQKNGMDRMYINASTLGLDCCYYKTGNISGATFRGKSISNNEARGLKAAKTYIDLKHSMIVSDSCRLAAAVAETIGVDGYSYGEKQIKIA